MASTVLVVDDDATVRELLRLGLEKEGYEVIEYTSGIGVLDKLQNHQVDLVILDILMDEKSGIETLEEIRNSGLKTPVIMISGSDKYLSYSLFVGATRLLTKPIDLQELITLVEELIE